jgi:hypothetical protein
MILGKTKPEDTSLANFLLDFISFSFYSQRPLIVDRMAAPSILIHPGIY